MTDKPATHVAVPLSLFNLVIKVLNPLPYEQVNGLMAELKKCGAINVTNPEDPPEEP